MGNSRGATRREAIVAFLAQYQSEFGYAPSVREITEAVGLRSTFATRQHLQQLEDDGRIRLQPGSHRSIVLVEVGDE